MTSVVSRCLCILAALMLVACTERYEPAPIGGDLMVLEPSTSFATAMRNGKLPDGWRLEGNLSARVFDITVIDQILALEAQPDRSPYALYRPMLAQVLATPYLSWSWRGALPRDGQHPLRIVIGIHNRGVVPERAWYEVWQSGESRLSRVIDVAWDGSALRRGTLIGPVRRSDGVERITYVARGGPEQAGVWQTDAVDLSQILAQAWPDDDPSAWEIRYIGIASTASSEPVVLSIANLRLSR